MAMEADDPLSVSLLYEPAAAPVSMKIAAQDAGKAKMLVYI
ncbi:hypothetical protein [Sphingobium baderi]|nr:hypothetical protein [Sphingobium baderi]